MCVCVCVCVCACVCVCVCPGTIISIGVKPRLTYSLAYYDAALKMAQPEWRPLSLLANPTSSFSPKGSKGIKLELYKVLTNNL